MSLTIEQIEEQIVNLQKTLETLKNPKLEVSRSFTGQYFAPYQGILYRRMESDGVPIWESYLDIKKEWVLTLSKELKQLEKTYQNDCVVQKEDVETSSGGIL
jgi:hypothetical protein